MSIWKRMASDNLVERNCGIWKAAARKAIKDVGVRGFVEIRRLSMANWAKNGHINSSGYSRAQWVIGRGYKLPWWLLDEKQSGELASLELPDHSPEFGRRMSWLWCEARLRNHGHWPPFETCGCSRCPSKCSHTRDCERGKSRKKQHRRADGACYPSVSRHCCPQREEQRVCVLSRSRDESCTRMSPKGKCS